MDLSKILIAFGISLILSLTLTPLTAVLARRWRVIDRPREERWNEEGKPRLGGLGIFAGFIGALSLIKGVRDEVLIIVAFASFILLIGLLDDKYGTKPLFKFIAQLIAAGGTMALGVRMKITPAYLAIPVTALWLIGLTNAMNLLDNMDGLAGGVSALIAGGIAIMTCKHPLIPAVAAAVAGGCLGFLVYNFNPSKLFMGDCGALFLGYTLSALAIEGFWKKSSPWFPSLLVPFFIFSVPIFDTTLVTVSRLKSKIAPWHGGKDHSSHRLVTLGLSERKAVLVLYSLTALGCLTAFAVLSLPPKWVPGLASPLAIIMILMGWRLLRTGSR